MNHTEISPDSANLPFVEELYAAFLKDQTSVSPTWREFFESLSRDDPSPAQVRIGPSFQPHSIFNPPSKGGRNGHATGGEATQHVTSLTMAVLQDRVDQLIRAYRVRGHKIAQIDPLGIPRSPQPELSPEYYGFTEQDLDRPFSTRTIEGAGVRTLRRILERLHNTYCRSIGVQFMHIDSSIIRSWLQDRMEGTENRVEISRSEQLRVLECLTNAVVFEEFIHRKFVGAKRFSLEGGETLIPLLDRAIERAGDQGLEQVVLGMAHRGRLNVLANVMGKCPNAIFREFEDADPQLHRGRGDVKYHLGYTNDWYTAGGKKVHLSLCFNPSHLEYVNPVAIGRVRAKQDRFGDVQREKGMCILIHGDAAFAGEGIIQETLNLSELKGYETGGTLHIVVNNQIGFTTTSPEGRSCTYATDVAKMLQIPIFHVNGEDPEAVAQVVKLAMDFRKEFKRDVVIDMYCYRRYGHNEGDEPWFTQPLMYSAIEKKKTVRESYLEKLLEMGGISREEADLIADRTRERLTQELSIARSDSFLFPREKSTNYWLGYHGGPESQAEDVPTYVDADRLSGLLQKLTEVPTGFVVHPKIERMLDNRRKIARGEEPVDWSAAETLALATISLEGNRVRLTGQDCERGTFSHRHSVLHHQVTGETYCPLKHLDPKQAPLEIHNSPLSESGVLGFEYGYSLDWPDGLIMWEAQFGDFCNVAQVIIDQFLVSAEDKWRRLSGLVLLLPHGYEGQGPEHSSARLERFLTLAAEDNIQVANCTTPAQYFHLLRRQVVRRWRKPLVVMTPKRLLRQVSSPLSDLSEGSFQRIIPDHKVELKSEVDRVLLCSGQVYYDLERQREQLGRNDVAILRIEQLYPLYERYLEDALAPYPAGTPVIFVQEEPENMGAWRYLKCRFGSSLFERYPFSGVYRDASASPATGSNACHKLEQQDLLEKAFGKVLQHA